MINVIIFFSLLWSFFFLLSFLPYILEHHHNCYHQGMKVVSKLRACRTHGASCYPISSANIRSLSHHFFIRLSEFLLIVILEGELFFSFWVFYLWGFAWGNRDRRPRGCHGVWTVCGFGLGSVCWHGVLGGGGWGQLFAWRVVDFWCERDETKSWKYL